MSVIVALAGSTRCARDSVTGLRVQLGSSAITAADVLLSVIVLVSVLPMIIGQVRKRIRTRR